MTRSNQNAVGPRLRQLRSSRSWTQEQVVARIQQTGWGLTRGAYAQIESQRRGLSDCELIVLARVFDTSLDDLLGSKEVVAAALSERCGVVNPGKIRPGRK